MSPQRSLHFFVLIDALGWTLIDNRDFLCDRLPYRQPLRTILGYSSGAIPTILTGKPPAEHGHWNLLYYDPDGSPFRWLKPFGAMPGPFLNHRVSRKLLKEMGRRLLGLGPLFEVCVHPRLLPWLNWIERRNIYRPRGITGSPSIFDHLTDQAVPYRAYSYHHGTDAQIFEQVRRDLHAQDLQFVFIYLSGMDRFLHHHCSPDAVFERTLDWYATALRQVFEQAQALDPGATFTVVSDHGMTPVRGTCDLVPRVEAVGLAMPTDYLAVYDSTMARFWFFNDGARQTITESLHAVPCGRVLVDEELRELGILFPDRRYGELIFLLEPGWLVAGSDFNGRGWTPAGMHGYHPDDSHSDGIFLSNQRPATDVRTIADVYRQMTDASRIVVEERAQAR